MQDFPSGLRRCRVDAGLRSVPERGLPRILGVETELLRSLLAEDAPVCLLPAGRRRPLSNNLGSSCLMTETYSLKRAIHPYRQLAPVGPHGALNAETSAMNE